MDKIENLSEREISSIMEDLPPTTFELAAAENRKVSRVNELRDILTIRRANRTNGFPEPKVGTKLWVTTARGIRYRRRAGLAFERDIRAEVRVIEGDPEEIAAKQIAGAYVTDVAGAERILADSAKHGGLSVSYAPAPDRSEELLAAEEELRLARAEIAELRAARDAAAAEARRNAPRSEDGRSNRLRAADAATAQLDKEIAEKVAAVDGDDPPPSLGFTAVPAPAAPAANLPKPAKKD